MRTVWCTTPIAPCRARNASTCARRRHPPAKPRRNPPRPSQLPRRLPKCVYTRCQVTSPTNDQVFNNVSAVDASIAPGARTAGRPPAAGAAQWTRLSGMACGRPVVHAGESATAAATRWQCACSTPMAVPLCAGPVTNFHVRQASILMPGRKTAARSNPCQARGKRLVNALRDYHSPLSHFEPTELFDTLSTGIVVLDAQLLPHLRQCQRAGLHGGEPAAGARPALRRPVLRSPPAGRGAAPLDEPPGDLHAARAGAEGAGFGGQPRSVA